MKKFPVLLTVSLLVLFVAGCSQQPTTTATTTTPSAAGATTPGATVFPASGTVAETIDAAGYTYVQVDLGSEKIWAVAPKFQAQVGDKVTVPEGMPMKNYHSKSLDRDFDMVYFVSAIQGGAPAKGTGMPGAHSPPAGSTPTPVDVTGIEKAEGGVTVGELFAGKADLAGQQVTLRGKVVKYNSQILGKNWLHVQDGSGDAAARTNDLTVTTDATAKVGDTVLISGAVTLDKDFTAGYKYNVIIEDAKVTVE